MDFQCSIVDVIIWLSAFYYCYYCCWKIWAARKSENKQKLLVLRMVYRRHWIKWISLNSVHFLYVAQIVVKSAKIGQTWKFKNVSVVISLSQMMPNDEGCCFCFDQFRVNLLKQHSFFCFSSETHSFDHNLCWLCNQFELLVNTKLCT